jgi:ribosomal subunit interface protein
LIGVRGLKIDFLRQKRYIYRTMNINIHAKNLELNAPLRAFIEEKMADIEHLIGDSGPAQAQIEVGIPSHHHNTGSIYYAEVNLTIGGKLLRAEATNFDLHSAIVDVKDDLKVQIKKFKEKLTEAQRQPASE